MIIIAVPVDHRVKIKDSENFLRYQDVAREMEKLRNMKMTVIPIVVGALRTVPEGL